MSLNDGLSGSLGGSPLFNKEISLFHGTPHEAVQHQVAGGSKIIYDSDNQNFYIQDDSDSGSSWIIMTGVS